jgi:hypothetical protein
MDSVVCPEGAFRFQCNFKTFVPSNVQIANLFLQLLLEVGKLFKFLKVIKEFHPS